MQDCLSCGRLGTARKSAEHRAEIEAQIAKMKELEATKPPAHP